jgi:CRISPR-associated protein Cas1
MGWRILGVRGADWIALDNGRLTLDQQGHETLRIPPEDLDAVCLDAIEGTLTGQALAAMAEAGALLLILDRRHMPAGMLLPISPQHRGAEAAIAQARTTQGLKNALWKRIVAAKIRNQAAVLAGFSVRDSRALEAMASRLRPGDPDGVEARAARIYFHAQGLRRDDEADPRNAYLNYGYAVLRAAVARSLALHGLLLPLGIWHQGIMNPANLADDLIEPWRPVVDKALLIRLRLGPIETPLPREDREAIVRLLLAPILMDGNEWQVHDAIDVSAGSLRTAFVEQRPDALRLPTVSPLPIG